MCLPKKGGLGIFKGLEQDHNKEDILWVKWIHSFIIKIHNFWYMKIPPES